LSEAVTPIVISNISGLTPTPEAKAAFTRYTDAIKAQLLPVMTDGVYLSFLEGEEARRRTQDSAMSRQRR
jgi:hypothetical protein